MSCSPCSTTRPAPTRSARATGWSARCTRSPRTSSGASSRAAGFPVHRVGRLPGPPAGPRRGDRGPPGGGVPVTGSLRSGEGRDTGSAVHTGTWPVARAVAVVVVRDGRLPVGADEAVAEAGGVSRRRRIGSEDGARALVGAVRVRWAETGAGLRPGSLARRLAPVVGSRCPGGPAGVARRARPGPPAGRGARPPPAGPGRGRRVPVPPAGAGPTGVGHRDPPRRPGAGAGGGRRAGGGHPGAREPRRAGPTATACVIGSVDARDLEPGRRTGPTGARPRGHRRPRARPPHHGPGRRHPGDGRRGRPGGRRSTTTGGREVFDLLVQVAAAIGASAGPPGWPPMPDGPATSARSAPPGWPSTPTSTSPSGCRGPPSTSAGSGRPRHIVSVNTDASCPMTAMADLGLVTDARRLLVELGRRFGVQRWPDAAVADPATSEPGLRMPDARPPSTPSWSGPARPGRRRPWPWPGPAARWSWSSAARSPGRRTSTAAWSTGGCSTRSFPRWWEEVPVERWVVRRSTMMMTGTQSLSIDYRSEAWGSAPFNGMTTLRSHFDTWLAAKATGAGATLLTSTVATGLVTGRARPGGRRPHRPRRRRTPGQGGDRLRRGQLVPGQGGRD